MNIEITDSEFKREYISDIKNTIVAFANTKGGVLKVGIDNNGNVYSLDNVDYTLTQISNSIRDSIIPDITMSIDYSVRDDKAIEVTVREGTNKPYFLKDKGIKPSGIYVRRGASTVPASWEQIRTMIKQTDGDKYESLRSFEQNLTFSFAKEEFSNKNLPFDEPKYITLGIMNLDKTYSNLGEIISDQCKHTIKVAVFEGVEKAVFKDRREFGGSLLKQLRDVYDYLDLTNKTQATFSGLERIDKRDYSEMVIREALVNAIVHRDYAFSGSIIINVYDDKMEFISLGGLVGGLSEEDIKSGISQTRNEKLANIFFRLKYIETYGYGLPNIFRNYEQTERKPIIKVTDNTFVIIIPNKNYKLQPGNISRQITGIANENYLKVIDYIRTNGSITRIEVETVLGVKQSRAYQVLRKMVDDGLIISSKVGGKKAYVLLS